MKLVIDANRVISAALRDGSTRRVLIETQSELWAPNVMRQELERHRASLLARSGITTTEFDELIEALMFAVGTVEEPEYRPFLRVAEAAIGHVDPDDVYYLAAALAIGADAIWSEDTDFDAQTLVPRTRHPDRLTR